MKKYLIMGWAAAMAIQPVVWAHQSVLFMDGSAANIGALPYIDAEVNLNGISSVAISAVVMENFEDHACSSGGSPSLFDQKGPLTLTGQSPILLQFAYRFGNYGLCNGSYISGSYKIKAITTKDTPATTCTPTTACVTPTTCVDSIPQGYTGIPFVIHCSLAS